MKSDLTAFSKTKFRPFFFPRGGAGGGGSVFVPTNSIVVLDAANISGVHHDPVNTWPDSSGNERDGIASAAGPRLDLTTMTGPCVDFTVNRFRVFSSTIPDGSRPYTLIMALKLDNVVSTHMLSVWDSPTNKGLLQQFNSEWRAFQGGGFDTMGPVPTNTPTILVHILNGANSVARVNGAEKALNQSASDTGTRNLFRIGYDTNNATAPHKVGYTAMVDGVIDSGELASLEEALAERYTITLA